MARKKKVARRAARRAKAPKVAPLKDKASILKTIDDVLFFLEGVAPMTPWAADDTAVRFLKFARNDPAFLRFIDRITAAKAVDPDAPKIAKLQSEPELQALFNRWADRAAVEGDPSGSFGEIISLIFQVVAWVKAFKAKRTPAPA